jgi:hypothetical protein
MAHFIQKYTDNILKCTDFAELNLQVKYAAANNVFEFVSTDIKNKIEKLELINFDEFIESLAEIVISSNFSETAMNLLTEICNRIVKEFDSLINQPNNNSLVIMTICADDKSFVNKLSQDEKEQLFIELSKNFLVISYKSDLTKEMNNIFTISMEKILNGYTIEQLDNLFKSVYDSLFKMNDYTADHLVNELARPFQALFMNIVHNVDKKGFLMTFLVNKKHAEINDKIEEISLILIKKAKNANIILPFSNGENIDPADISSIIRELTGSIYWYNDELIKNGNPNFICKETGHFLLHFLDWIHYIKESLPEKVTPDQAKKVILLLLDHIMYIIDNYYNINNVTKMNVYTIIKQYRDDPNSEDALVTGDWLKAIKLHLDKDPSFNLLLLLMSTSENEDISVTNKNRTTDTFNRVYMTYLSPYCNPLNKNTFTTVPATEATRNKNNEEDDDYNDDEENITKKPKKPKIQAVQSTKGYDKTSKGISDKERKIYNAYKKYKNYEEKIDSQLSKMLVSAKDAFTQDKTEEIIEGKKFSPIGLLKKVLASAAIFSFSKVAGFVHLVLRYALNKNRTRKQKEEILIDLQTEISILDEKIEEAKGDGNRQAKYALMRTRAELQRAYEKIKYDLNANKSDLATAYSHLKSSKNKGGAF